MLHAVLLAATLTLATDDSSAAGKTPVQQCFATMDGAVYHGDPSDRLLMRANVAACESGIVQIGRMRPGIALGPEKLFLTARILDRAATLSYMGLNDANTALPEVKLANLYFRVAAGLPNEPASYSTAAAANAQLTSIQLRTLRSEVALARTSRAPRIVSRVRAKTARSTRAHDSTTAAYTAYHKL